jgi:hypothetical protein
MVFGISISIKSLTRSFKFKNKNKIKSLTRITYVTRGSHVTTL